MYISDFVYHKPDSIGEACRILTETSDAVPLAGGTDLLVEIKQGLRFHHNIVSLTNITELKSISEDTKNLYIGAGITHNEIIASSIINNRFTVLANTASRIGTDQIRNTGTIGGNLCTGASCCDMAPILMALGANVELSNSHNTRIISLKDFFTTHKVTVIKKGEILTKIIIPRIASNTGACFEKFGLREAASISVASAAVMMKFNDNICTDACIVIGAVAPKPIICHKASLLLVERKISEIKENSSVLKQAGGVAAEDSAPIDDLRGSAEYRRDLIKILVQRAAINAAADAIENS